MSFSATIKSTVAIVNDLPVGTNRVSQVSVPYNPSDVTIYLLSTNAGGTGANGATRYIQRSGSLVATTLDIDLTAEVCSDGQVGLAHYRAGRVRNLSSTDPLIVGLGTNPITASFMGGTTPTVTIPPLGFFEIPPMPLGTNGYTVDSTHKILRLNSGSATVAYEVYLIGD